MKPEVLMTPTEEINWVVGEKFTIEVWVHNITKMKSLHFELDWKWRLHQVLLKNGTWDVVWLQLLNVSKADVVINSDIFPKANRTYSVDIKKMVLDASHFEVHR